MLYVLSSKSKESYYCRLSFWSWMILSFFVVVVTKVKHGIMERALNSESGQYFATGLL